MNEQERVTNAAWKQWGAYVTERQWGTVREDYSADGNAWDFLTHDMARSYAYRWGEDGIAGLCDMYQIVVFSPAFWNGKDPILKERLFGLNQEEGNHGEDVKECYYYLDATPTHSYLKYLYKYPHEAFPYDILVAENRRRTTRDPEFELIDTAVFNNGNYFDIFIEYAKAAPDDICIRIQAFNRANNAATLHIIPQIWFRNFWSYEKVAPPKICKNESSPYTTFFIDTENVLAPVRFDPEYRIKPFYLYAQAGGKPLFTNNETNNARFLKQPISPFVKDAFHENIIHNKQSINPEEIGTKAGLQYSTTIAPHSSFSILLRITPESYNQSLDEVPKIIEKRKKEADDFYSTVHRTGLSDEEKLIQRQALSGLLWTKQYYYYDVEKWLTGDNSEQPPPASRYHIRNTHWQFLYANTLLSMPDKWEYPWFAAWDLAYQTIALSLVDPICAKEQLLELLTHRFQNANGQIPAYEWRFSDLNPPVQAWALWKIYTDEKAHTKKGDRVFLESGFVKLVQNFCWWVNKVDRHGNNFFEGGFLGLDNISIIDRSKPLPGGGCIEQSDGTGWMGLFSLMLLRIALELAKEDPVYELLATTFFEQFVYISQSFTETKFRTIDMWDSDDGFFYDVVCYPNGYQEKIKIRSLVGIVPLFSITHIDENELKQLSRFYKNFQIYCSNHPKLVEKCVLKTNSKYILTLVTVEQITRVLERVWDPDEFASPFGLRSLSKYHEQHPFTFNENSVAYEPAESTERIKGGNSNWRGPVWMPTSFIFIDSLKRLSAALGDTIQIYDKNRQPVSITTIASSFAERSINIFKKDASGMRPVHGNNDIYQTDPNWNNLVLFFEYYNGNTGKGLGAAHQTGWSSLVANLLAEWKSH